ncbi:hypothetical protein FCL47_17360 [Desulfopila sp. IMCC35006]|uniref:hypothetical protein n=1 Tax=Desulfopila sp. IMCC35006 TaxID=2569542 RepID=UPI0010AB7D8B|nr:hypothetical protein [Desulfopila sp. IMCC35006]TKB24603.1 hypothetical protein FCL47_17360 [Desulfopila sp. IMCC35006]
MEPFKNILYVNESNAEQTATHARAVSLTEKNQAVLTFVDVIPTPIVQVDMALPPGGPISTKLQAFIVADRRNTLNTILRSYRQRPKTWLAMLCSPPAFTFSKGRSRRQSYRWQQTLTPTL